MSKAKPSKGPLTGVYPQEIASCLAGVTPSAFLLTSDLDGGSDLDLQRDQNLCIKVDIRAASINFDDKTIPSGL